MIAKAKYLFSLCVGIIMVICGAYYVTPSDIDVSVVKASVVSVTWNGENDCGVTYVKGEEVKEGVEKEEKTEEEQEEEESADKEGYSVVYNCDVVAKYQEGDSEKEYEFYSASEKRYKSDDEIDLYKFDGKLSNLDPDPNAGKDVGWILVIFGALLAVASLSSLLVCYAIPTFCAIQEGVSIGAYIGTSMVPWGSD